MSVSDMVAHDSQTFRSKCSRCCRCRYGEDLFFFALTHTKTKPRTHGCLSSDSVDDYRAFYLETLKALDKAPSYERAKQKKGPVRCWFTKNANVVFSGCESKMIAEPFAAAFLKKTAKAKGTKKQLGRDYTSVN